MEQINKLECLAEYLELHPEWFILINLQLDQILVVYVLCVLDCQDFRDFNYVGVRDLFLVFLTVEDEVLVLVLGDVVDYFRVHGGVLFDLEGDVVGAC